jgi:hypothetical protein
MLWDVSSQDKINTSQLARDEARTRLSQSFNFIIQFSLLCSAPGEMLHRLGGRRTLDSLSMSVEQLFAPSEYPIINSPSLGMIWSSMPVYRITAKPTSRLACRSEIID